MQVKADGNTISCVFTGLVQVKVTMPGWAAAVHHAVIDEDELANQGWGIFSDMYYICVAQQKDIIHRDLHSFQVYTSLICVRTVDVNSSVEGLVDTLLKDTKRSPVL